MQKKALKSYKKALKSYKKFQGVLFMTPPPKYVLQAQCCHDNKKAADWETYNHLGPVVQKQVKLNPGLTQN